MRDQGGVWLRTPRLTLATSSRVAYTAQVPSARVLLAQIDVDLAEARQRRDELDHAWGHAMYTAGCRRNPAKINVELAGVQAQIVELEERRSGLASAPTPVAPAALVAAAPELPEYLDAKEAAALLGVSVKRLQGMRARGKGPPFVRVGRRVRYRRSDLR
jgi:hypothetical protein